MPRPLKPDDVFLLKLITDVQLSPDGRSVAYVVRTADRRGDRYRSAIWIADVDSGATRKLTHGKHQDAQPRWSPDSKTIAFTSGDGLAPPGRKGVPRNLYVVDLTRAGARQLTDLADDVSMEVTYPIISEAFAWSPTGDQICFAVKDPPPDGAPESRAYVYDRLRYKSGELGWWDGRRKHLWLVSIADGVLRRLTSGDWDAYGPAFSPDGRQVAFSSSRLFGDSIRNTLPDTNPSAPKDIWITAADGRSEPRPLTKSNGPNMSPSFSPNGRMVAYFGHQVADGGWGHNTHLWVQDADGGEPEDLLTGWDHTAGSHVMSDVHDVYAPPPAIWSRDGSTLYFQGTVRGAANVFAVDRSGSAPRAVTSGDHEVMLASLDCSCTHVAALIGDERRPSDLHVGAVGGPLRRLTTINEDLFQEIYTATAERFTYAGRGLQIDGFLLKPPDFTVGRRHPLILEIFPSFVHGRAFNFEYQMLAGHGYVVFFANPRGATSYGEEFLRGSFVRGQYFTDYQDLMNGVDYLVAQGIADESRLGVTGDAYGGTMTNWLIGQTGRFAASVARRGATNMWLNAGDRYLGLKEGAPDPYREPLPFLEQSPILHVHNVTTPHLIIHSMDDRRYPVGASEEFFAALRSLGKTARLVIFRNDAHFLSRMGPPGHRAEFFAHILSWFDRYLKPENSALPNHSAEEGSPSHALGSRVARKISKVRIPGPRSP